jgi:hypothetical protein
LTTTPYRVVPDLAGQLSRAEVGWASLTVSVARPVPGPGVGVVVGEGGAVGDGLVGAGVVGDGGDEDGDGDGEEDGEEDGDGDGDEVVGFVAEGDGAALLGGGDDGVGDGEPPPAGVPAMRNWLSATFQWSAR